MNKLGKNLIKAGMVTTSILMAVALTAGEITSANRNAISKQLKQPTFELVQKEGTENEKVDNIYYKSKYQQEGKTLADLINDGKKLSEKIETEGVVLLSNNGALPLAKNEKVSLFGINSEIPSYGGRGSSHTKHPQDPTDLYEGFEEAGLKINPIIRNVYKTYATANFSEESGAYIHSGLHEMQFAEIQNNAGALASIDEYGTAIYTLSRVGAESSDIDIDPQFSKYDRKTNQKDAKERGTLNLSRNEKEVLSKLAELKTQGKVKKIIVLINATNPIAIGDFLDEYSIDASMWIGHLGITGSIGVGKLLNGTSNPSGSLPDTFYYQPKENPILQNYPFAELKGMENFSEFGDATKLGSNEFKRYYAYQEGIYVGYRYAETRYTDIVMGRDNAAGWDYAKSIAYPFGSGLSYTTFKYSDFDVQDVEDGYDITVKVTNTGTLAGKDAVEIYLQKPYTQYDIDNKIEKSAVDLVGFDKTELLQPNASETVTVHVNDEALKVYDSHNAETYIVTEGDYKFTAASDAHKAANNFLASNGKTTADGMTENGDAEMVKSFHRDEDKISFSKSRGGNKQSITNLFSQADINTYDGRGDNSLEYLTRNNWSKQLTSDIHATAELVADLLKQKNSDWIQPESGAYPTYGPNLGAGEMHPLQLISLLKDSTGKFITYDDPSWETFLDQLSWDETVELIRIGIRMTNALPSIGKPMTNDHNGPTGLTEYYDTFDNGIASKTNDPLKHVAPVYYPSIPTLAASRNVELAAEYGEMLGEDALWAGYNGFYGVALNTHRSPYAGRHFEYWSEDPFLTGYMATAQVKALQAKGCNAYIKHFALNDHEAQRNNSMMWVNEQTLREIYLRPFEMTVIDGQAMNAMVSFTRIGAQMCPASKPLLTDFLRGELGMRGVTVTDMYNIGYTPEMMPSLVLAGCNIPDGELEASAFDKYKTGYPQVARAMRESAKRLCYSTLLSSAMNGIDNNTIIRQITPQWEKLMNGFEYTTIALFSIMSLVTVIFAGLEIKSKYFKKK